jgi:hypothetical protein
VPVADEESSHPIMIPGKIVRFLEQHANVGLGGARDRNLAPFGCRLSGWRVGPDGHTLTALIAPVFAGRILESLQDNGQFAMTFEENPTHETYQLKGRYVRHREIVPDDLVLVASLRDRLAKSMRSQIPPGVDEAYVVASIVPHPSLALEIDVREVYVQTPGPGAGGRLYPPPDAPSLTSQA